ncbi:hypothetical protein NH8B_3542 [Pseudogulbenkiania sp. NH8B]|nr:hypothetical protein NH8B_3542 [Pseudogulbenkiania sp. NH8B]
MNECLFTPPALPKGHPDKVTKQPSDTILRKDKNANLIIGLPHQRQANDFAGVRPLVSISAAP